MTIRLRPRGCSLFVFHAVRCGFIQFHLCPEKLIDFFFLKSETLDQSIPDLRGLGIAVCLYDKALKSEHRGSAVFRRVKGLDHQKRAEPLLHKGAHLALFCLHILVQTLGDRLEQRRDDEYQRAADKLSVTENSGKTGKNRGY